VTDSPGELEKMGPRTKVPTHAAYFTLQVTLRVVRRCAGAPRVIPPGKRVGDWLGDGYGRMLRS